MKVFNFFWNILDKKQKVLFFVLIFCSIIQTILEMIGIAAAIPFVTFLLEPEKLSEINFISNYIKLDNIILTDKITLIFCIIFFLIFLLKNLIIIITNKLAYKFIFNFRVKLFKNLINKIMNQEYVFFIKKGISQIFNTTINEVDVFAINIVKPIIILICELSISFGILILIISTGNINGLILVSPIIIIVALILRKINQSIKSWSLTRINENEKIIDYNLNLVNGIKEILVYGKVKTLIDQFDYSLKSLRDIDIKHNLVSTYPKILLEQIVILIFILIILILNYFNTPNDEIIILLSFYLVASYRLVPSINKIFVSYQSIKFGKPSIPKIMEYYNLSTDTFIENEKITNPLIFEKNLELKNLSFSYKKNINIIENLNFKINKNEIIGIIGESGTGKSTIVNLLVSLLKPEKGKIILDKKVIENPIELRRYQNLFSISTQDPYLVAGTIKDNIIFGSKDNFSEKKIFEAINFAKLDKMIKGLTFGLDTFIGSTIKQLSSGQKQRISIARTFYSNREILIFDEATNALDEKNEQSIFENLKNLKKIKTIIIISHNKENLKICDKVFEFKDKILKEIF
jgi:ABC-type multidrug transport system fused ATPase/permease subunit